MTTPTLTDFLLARIEEDEEAARRATAGPWTYNPGKEWFTDSDKLRAARAGIQQSGGEEHVSADGGATGVAATGPSDDPQSMADAAHIARHDPARVVADCKAKRVIVDLHTVAHYCADDTLQDVVAPPYFGVAENVRTCPTLLALAQPYADHEDFRDEWRI